MKRLFIRTSAGAGLLATLAFAPMATMAQHKCDQPASTIDRRACAKAAEGPDALREFVFRTRMIWGLYYWDYAPRQEQVTQTREAVKPASVEAGEPRKVVKSE